MTRSPLRGCAASDPGVRATKGMKGLPKFPGWKLEKNYRWCQYAEASRRATKRHWNRELARASKAKFMCVSTRLKAHYVRHRHHGKRLERTSRCFEAVIVNVHNNTSRQCPLSSSHAPTQSSKHLHHRHRHLRRRRTLVPGEKEPWYLVCVVVCVWCVL
jgi:hypothetical protein